MTNPLTATDLFMRMSPETLQSLIDDCYAAVAPFEPGPTSKRVIKQAQASIKARRPQSQTTA